MALTSGAPRMATPGAKTNNIWLKKWSRMPKPKKVSLPLYMRKLLIYYPKNLQALKPFTLEAFKSPIYKNSPQFTQWWKRLCKNIVNRYKRVFFKHLEIDFGFKGPFPERLIGYIQSLKIDRGGAKHFRAKIFQKKFIKYNKYIKVIEIAGDPLYPEYMYKLLKTMRKAESMSISGSPFVKGQDQKRIIMNKNHKLKYFNVMGSVYEAQAGLFEEFLKKWKMVAIYSTLKKMRYDAEIHEGFDINLLPFSEFRKRNINFDVRAIHSADDLLISEANIPAFQDIDFLGINTKKEWLSSTAKWDIVEKDHLNLQNTANNLLFLSLHEMMDFIDLASLLHSCRNIVTLDLILSELNTVHIDFTELQELHCLKNVFIQLHSYHIPPHGLFQSLALCAQKHKKIEYFVLEFFSGILFPDIEVIKDLLGACAPTLKTFYLQFSLITGYLPAIETVYQTLDVLVNLETLGILVTAQAFRMSEFEGAFGVHAQCLQNLLNDKPKLQNFYFVASDIDTKKISINFGGTEHLKKLGFLFSGRESDSNLIESIIELKDVTHLEIGFTGQDEQEWCNLIKGLKHLKNLEVVRFREVPISTTGSECCILQELKDLSMRNPKFELMLFNKRGEFEVLLCPQSYYIKEVDTSFWCNYIDLPFMIPNKVYFS